MLLRSGRGQYTITHGTQPPRKQNKNPSREPEYSGKTSELQGATGWSSRKTYFHSTGSSAVSWNDLTYTMVTPLFRGLLRTCRHPTAWNPSRSSRKPISNNSRHTRRYFVFYYSLRETPNNLWGGWRWFSAWIFLEAWLNNWYPPSLNPLSVKRYSGFVIGNPKSRCYDERHEVPTSSPSFLSCIWIFKTWILGVKQIHSRWYVLHFLYIYLLCLLNKISQF